MRDELQTARRNFPRAEYQLVKDSFPETLHHLSKTRLNEHIARCERLIASYKTRLRDKESREHVWRGSTKLSSGRLIRYRMNHLNISLRKFKAELKTSAAPARRAKATAPRKRTLETRSIKAKRSTSAKMKSGSSSMKSSRTGTTKRLSASSKKSHPINSGSRRMSASHTSTKMKRQPKYPDLPESKTEEVSHTLTSQPKMRLSRRGGKKSSAQFRERQRRESGSSSQVNPSSRIR